MTGRAVGGDLIVSLSSALLDTRQFKIDGLNGGRTGMFAEDRVTTDMTYHDLADLMESPHWEDRIRAQQLLVTIKPVLTDGFPVIYETTSSPNRQRGLAEPSEGRIVKHVWVKHPKVGVLAEALDRYQGIWDAYVSGNNWGPGSYRQFAVTTLNGVEPYGVFRPEATVQDIISKTFLTHDGMLRYQSQEEKDAHAEWLDTERSATRLRGSV